MARVTLFRLALLGAVWFAACGQVASDPDPTTPSKVLDPQPQIPGDGVVTNGATVTSVGVSATSGGNDSGAVGSTASTTGGFFGTSAASGAGGSSATGFGGAGGSDGSGGNGGNGGNGALGGQAGQAGERGEGGEQTTAP